MAAGKVPYRDFHFWCPPGHLLIYQWLIELFGDGLIYVRAFAVVERLATFVLTYFWLARVFSVRAALFATLVAGFGYSSDVADVIAHYGFDAMLATVAAGFAASLAIGSTGRRASLLYVLTGVCAGCCMVAKQTQGVGLFFVLLVISLAGDMAAGRRFRARAAAMYVVGWVIPTGLVAVWLARAGAWEAFVNQTFLSGTSSKGPLWSVLLRPLVQPLTIRSLGAPLLAALLLMAVYAWLKWKDRDSVALQESSGPWMLWLACLAAVAVGCGIALAFPMEKLLAAMMMYSTMCIFMSLFGSAALAALYSWGAVRGKLDARGLQMWLLASVSATAAYMFSLSWAAFEQMLIPGFAFLMALAMDSQVCTKARWREWAVVGLGLVLISTAAVRKMTLPYAWQNWVDGPMRLETEASSYPELRGIRVTARTLAFLNKVTETIDAHSRPDDTIFCFPNYALFYVLAHRQPGVFAYMHWFDIASDGLVREDLARIRSRPPAVIVSVEMSEAMMKEAELRFRNGHRSGQREMLEAIHSLPGYRLAESVPIPYQDYPVNIYVRD
jgi:hypothetical protein